MQVKAHKQVTIELSHKEAEVLMTILGHTDEGEDADSAPPEVREVVSNLWSALANIVDDGEVGPVYGFDGSLEFEGLID